MPSANLKTDLSYKSKQHDLILENMMARARFSRDKMATKHSQWQVNLKQHHAYLDLAAVDKARKSKARDDATYPGTAPIKIPLSKALGRVYIDYLMEVYTAIRPLFRYEGQGRE